jgi:hypothetical protein
MAKNLLVTTDRSPKKKLALNGNGGLPQLVGTAGLVTIHTVPAGYMDAVHLWVNNHDLSTNGTMSVTINGVLIRFSATNGFTTKYLFDNGSFEARGANLVIQAQATTRECVVFGYVFRSPLLS